MTGHATSPESARAEATDDSACSLWRWRWPRRHLGIFCALAVVLLLAAYLLVDRPVRRAPVPHASPLDAGGPFRVGIPVQRGMTATMGSVFLLNRGRGPVEIRSVELVNPRGLSFAGAVTYLLGRVGQRPGSGPLIVLGYPPAGFAVERLDHPIPPSRRSPAGNLDPDFQILIGLRMESDAMATADAVEVHFRYQGEEQVARFPKSVRLCGANIAYEDC